MESREQVYTGKSLNATLYDSLAAGYDRRISHMFDKYKLRVIKNSNISVGDSVAVFCCGTGLEIPYILSKTRTGSKITGIDISREMLAKARIKKEEGNWQNTEFVQADICEVDLARTYDAVVCILGLSIIPNAEQGYQNIIKHLNQGGVIVFADMSIATGWKKIFNPLTIFLSKKYGGSRSGHRQVNSIVERIKSDFTQVSVDHSFLGAFVQVTGVKK